MILKIAMLGQKRIPSREGGVEIVVEELATRMVQRGHEVTCYNRRGHHVGGKQFDEEDRKEYQGVRLKSVFTIDKRGLAAMTASVSAAICASLGDYDVVHFHAEGPCAMIWLPKLFGKKCIATIHGLDHQRAKWGRFAKSYILFGEKMAAKYADEIIVLSDNVKQYFWNTYKRETNYIPNGVNRAERRQVDIIKEKYDLEKDEYILYLGRIVPEKGIHYLIDAYTQLETDKKLVIAGGASDTNEYYSKLKEKCRENGSIIFTGFVKGQELEELYSNAYLYVLPSDLEGMPLSLLEAMSYGNCCVVSDIDECASVVEDRALVFKKSDIADLKGKLEFALEHIDKTNVYKEDAVDFICRKYDWGKVVEETLRLYANK